ncbi:MAG: hypothetical protein COU46_00720 [Candidatus Niyogibacteria bacterium CG10_big_fil_rev_8_21_14_0_10_42_19]|uniref:HTH HARE-type domain-containing protein n=1 Tax=Candidatus Niyogibacteria bacterium CG10_big_fil_rev_8_21_14_0_10_42_19 TaxID=1974725 RepID=A0A2H0TIF0_9BACT|nr:MAG: hypothetical protein COU46_00720 [Candidatus Niyogibacteria bacterium CG10_big_fil_rev_8_21_14_0_10_42_19]
MSLPFRPEEINCRLFKNLPERSKGVLERRFGIGSSNNSETLEAIGRHYGITRERVRQIESHALARLSSAKKNDKEVLDALSYLKSALEERGNVVREDDLLEALSDEKRQKNYIHFLLTISDDIKYLRENEHFHERWVVDSQTAGHAEEILKQLSRELSDEPISEEEISAKLISISNKLGYTYPKNTLISWLDFSKCVAKNHFGEWGLIRSPYIRPRGVRDLAYLIMRRHGSPLHFREVASNIEKFLAKKAHEQTVHNELIKDERFVLVGRGLYALSEWGYEPGIVKDVIKAVLNKNGPLKREDLIKKVFQERHVKENTILINLQNRKHFKKLPDGKYTLV